MKKEKRRELTIEQLKTMFKISKLILWICIFATAIIAVIFLRSIFLRYTINGQNPFLGYYLLGMCLICFSKVTSTFLEMKIISLQKKQDQIVNLKEKSKEGDLKKLLYIKENAFTNSILCKNISKIEIKHIENTRLIVDICFGKELCIKDVKIPIDALLKEVNNQTKKSIATKLIDSIKLDNLEDENMKLTIEAGNLKYENEKVTNQNLFEWFIW